MPCTVIVKGVDDRTLAPMIVNVDDGEGDRHDRHRAGGSRRCASSATAGSNWTARALPGASFVFQGAVFAEPGEHVEDFVFADADDEATGDAYRRRVAVYHAPRRRVRPCAVVPSWRRPAAPAAPRSRPRPASRCSSVPACSAASTAALVDVSAAPEPIAGFFDETVFQPDPAGTAFVRDRFRVGRARGVRGARVAAVRPRNNSTAKTSRR